MPATQTIDPSSPLVGKSKKDLLQIAEMTGLLEPGKGKSWTIARLVQLIESGKPQAAEPKPAAATPPAAAEQKADAPRRPRGRPRKIPIPTTPAPTEPATAAPEVDAASVAPPTEKPMAVAPGPAADAGGANESAPAADGTVTTAGAVAAGAAVAAAEAAAAPQAPARRQTAEAHPRRQVAPANQEVLQGVLEIMPDGYGFLRKENYIQGARDVYVPPQYIRRFGLREGDLVAGPAKPPRDNDRYPAILYIKEVNGMPPERMVRRPNFDRLTPIYPDERFRLETVRNELSTRIIDLVAPIGKGQRGMIVSPPKAGKTILLQKLANAIAENNPEAKLIVLLIDERPEEVTDMQRTIKGEVVYSTFDKTPENHVKVTELVLERAMRLVELKHDVVVLLDSMTRLSRAYNLTINPTGRTLSGGLDPGALYGPKRFFGAARNIENGGSLTVIATSLIETGSRMDEMIYEEFKGTGNMEVYLDRKLSEKRIFPAIDINKSGTRREELLLDSRELDAVWTIRKAFGAMDTSAVTEMIINLLLKTRDNAQFISSVNISMNDKTLFDAMRGQNLSSQSTGGRNVAYSSTNGYSSNGYSAGMRMRDADG